jgi:hypothetical protein
MNDSGSKGNLAPHKGRIIFTPRPLPAHAAVEAAFDQFERGGWRIVDPIQRIWAGERDEAALTACRFADLPICRLAHSLTR